MSDEPVVENFNWGELGEQWWRAAARDCGASERQMKFACAKHRGTSNTGAGREAGYQSEDAALRQSAYKTFRCNAVQNLLAMAAVEVRGSNRGNVDGAEARRILSKLARGSDPAMKIRALEALQRIEDRAAEFGRTVDGDEFSEWRMVRDYLSLSNGGPALVQLWLGQNEPLSNLPLLHDVYRITLRDAPETWHAAVKRQSPQSRFELERRLADKNYQLKDRIKIWREIGVDLPEANGRTAAIVEADLPDDVEAPGVAADDLAAERPAT